MKPFVKIALITVPLVALGVGFLAYTVSNSAAPEQVVLAERAMPVSVIPAQTRSVRPEIIGFGRVEPARVHEAVAQVAGTAIYVNPGLRRGEILPEGAVLLRLSPTDFNLAIAQATTALHTAEARLQELTVTEANSRASLEIENQTLALREADLTRAETLFQAGTVTQTNRDTALTAVLAQRARVQNVESGLALLPTQRAVLTEQINAAQITLEQAQVNLARTELTLPYTARVSQVGAETGEFVRAGSTVAELDGIDAAEVEAQINMAALRQLLQLAVPASGRMPLEPAAITAAIRGLDLTVTVSLSLGGEAVEWQGTIDRLSDTIDPRTGAIGVIVRVQSAYDTNAPGNRPPLTQGMFVQVRLSAPALDGVILPRSALRDGVVFVADPDNRLRRIPVAPRLVQGEIVVIGDTIPQDTPVLVTPPSPAIDGMLLDPQHDDMAMQIVIRASAGPLE